MKTVQVIMGAVYSKVVIYLLQSCVVMFYQLLYPQGPVRNKL